MAKLTKAEQPFVIVTWEDAKADFDTVTMLDAHLTHEPAIMLTAGWLLIENAKGVSVACERCPEDDTYRARTFIPAGCNPKVVPYKLTRARPRKESPSSSSGDPQS